jgi:hypothetical protein
MIDDEDVHGGEMFGEASPVNDPQRTHLGGEANPFVVFAAGRRFEESCIRLTSGVDCA